MTTTMPHFSYHRPATLGEALALLEEYGQSARILAGGTDLIERMRAGIQKAEHLVSLGRVEGLDAVGFDAARGLSIGASARVSDVGRSEAVRVHYPTLALACDVMATPQICNMATVVGNIVNGSPAADTAPPLLAHDGRMVLVSSAGEREVPLAAFFQGPGRVDRKPDEIARELLVPAPAPGTGTGFQRISARSKIDIAAVLVSTLVVLAADGTVTTARIVLGAVAPTPLRCTEAEALLQGAEPTPELIEQAAEICKQTARPIEDTRASAEWRKAMVGVLSQRAIEEAVRNARGATQ